MRSSKRLSQLLKKNAPSNHYLLNGINRWLDSFVERKLTRRTRKNQESDFRTETLEPRRMLAGNVGDLIFQATFEDANVPVGQFRSFSSVSGLTATGDPVEVQNNFPAVGPASEGAKLLELDGTNGVFVNIANVPSSGLLLQGDYSPRRFFNAFQNTIEVLWNGTVVETLSRDGRGQDSTDFQTFALVLSGQSGGGRLEFRSITPNDEFGAGGLLDDIKVFELKQKAPVLQPINNRTVDENDTVIVQLQATDPDSSQEQLQFSAIRKPATATLDPATGEFRWTPNRFAAGRQFSIEVAVTDESGLTDTQTFRISVTDVPGDQPPSLQSVADRNVVQDNPVRIQLVATDTDSTQAQLVYSATQSPAGSKIDPATGLFEWTPSEFAVGRRFFVALSVTDQTGLTDTVSFRVSVSDGSEDLPPVLQAVGDRAWDEGQSLTIQLVATDPDSEPNQLRYAALRSPVGSTLDPTTGLFQWTPNRFTGGLRFGIDVQVTDETGLTDTQTFKVSVNDVEGNQAPQLQAIGDQSIDEGDPLVVQLVATDQDSDLEQLRFSALRSPIGSTLDPITGEFKWTPNSFAGGLRFGIDVQVTDETGLTDTKTFRVNVADVPAVTPVLRPIGDQTVRETEPLTIQLTATDSDSDQSQLRYSALRAPQGATLDPITGEFVWTPNAFAGGNRFGIDVQVTDETGLSDTQTFRVTVENLNEAPVLADIADQTVDRNKQLSFTAAATDADRPAETLAFSLTGNVPDGALIDPASGRFNWTPGDNAAVGLYMFNVVVTDEAGNEDSQQINIVVSAGNDEMFDLIEASRFETARSQTIEITEDTKQLSFNYEPTFDLADVDFINDAFEVALLDNNGKSLVHTTGTNRDSFFNVTEEEAAVTGANAELDGSTVKLDLSHIAPGTTANLVFRLVNNDDDTATEVRVTSIATSAETMLTPAGAASDPAAVRNAIPINFDNLSDVTGSLSIDYGKTSLNRATDSLFSQIELTNVGQVAVSGRMLAVFENPTTEQASLLQPDGRLPDGRFFIELATENGVLAAGETTRLRDLAISNPQNELFDFDLTILAEVNSAPTGFVSVPPSEMEAGQTLRYTAVAVDPDEGQVLSYSVAVGHENISIDEVSGQLTWVTTNDEIGSHAITLRATDPFGLFVEQSFTLDVQDSLQNRPPVFTTAPITDATASSGFEITTIATGDNPSGVGVIGGFQGPRIVTINADDQEVGVYEGTGNDRFDNEATYSTGEPERTGNAIQSGYTVDVGLPPFLNNTGINDILGLDQADFNGDGIRDLATLTYHYSNILRDGHFHDLVINFGDGDGGFGDPVIVEQIDRFTVKANFENFTVADINGDGEADLLWSLYQQFSNSNSFQFYTVLGNGDGTFQPSVLTTEGTGMGDFRVVDLDLDGNLDVVGRRQFVDDIGWMRGIGDGTFEEFVSLSPEDSFIFTRNDRTRAFQVADLDGDGDMDIVQGRRGDQGIQVLTNNGDLTFTETDVIGQFDNGGFVYYQAIQVADFTGDGFVDIFYSTYSSTNYSLIRGSADGFEEAGVVASPIEPHIGTGNTAGTDRPLDIDGDGDLDLVLGQTDAFASRDNGVRVLLNDGTGFFSNVAYSPTVDPNGQPNQDNQSNFAYTSGVLAGDYNNDGVTDLVAYTGGVGSFGSADFNSVSVLLGTRPGEFAAVRTFGAVEEVAGDIEVVPADFNNDGISDLLTVGGGMIELGLGDGTFAAPFQATPGRVGDHAELADFNNDGIIDLLLATGGRGSGNANGFHQVLLGNGDGTFEQSYLERDAGGGYGAASIADFNNDGFQDFITKSTLNGLVEVLLNDPTDPGTFTKSYDLDLEQNFAFELDAGDFDEDGIIDFVTIDGAEARLQTYRGLGDGTFELINEEFGLPSLDGNSGNSHAGDVNNDGHLDFVTFGNIANIIHLGSGDGTFAEPTFIYTEVPTSNFRTKNTELVDFDEDGNLDLIHGLTSNVLRLQRGLGDGTFAVAERYRIANFNGVPYIADVDNDGHLDLVMRPSTGNANLSSQVNFLFGVRDGLVDVLTIDLNGDGNEEVLTINEDNDRLKIFVGDNLGGLTRIDDVLLGRAPRAVATADLDGDGTLELITANRAGRSISVLSGDLESGYSVVDFDVDGAPVDVEVADLDGDGNEDVVVLDEFNNALWVFSGNGTTTLDTPVAVALGDVASKFVLADANGDGTIDAVVTLPETNRAMIVGGIGFQPVDAPIYVTTESAPGDIAVVDLNDDGNADLAVTLPDSNVLSVHYGLGGNQYARAQQVAVGENPTRVTAADADEDGRVDLVVTNSGDDTASVIFNRFDPNEIYRYDANAIDPDGDSLDYRVVDGPGGLFIDSATGEVIWAASPGQVGQHTVVLEANDGRGGVATQQYVIDVQPSNENSAPLIATEPVATIGANESFEYQAGSIDDDNDSLRYRIIDGPEGATIDPVTGLVQWDGRTDAAIKLGYAGFRTPGNVEVPGDSSLQPGNLTVEGWYNFHELTASNGRMILMKQDGGLIENGLFAGLRKTAYSLHINGNSEIVLQLDNDPDSTDTFDLVTPFVAENDRWYHFAFTFDDTTLEATIYVDGVAIASGTSTASLRYGENQNSQVGEAAQFVTFATIDNYRIWNEVRSESEIQEGLTRQYEDNAAIVLDYRFEDQNTNSVVDHSSFKNTGFLTPAGTRPIPAPGLANVGIHSFVIGVEDGRGGMATQTFDVEIVPELRGEIVGHLFDDVNGDGVQNDGSEAGIPAEPSLEGWQVYVDSNNNSFADPHEFQATTDADGNYRFDQLLPENYQLRVSPTAGFVTPEIAEASVVASQETAVVTAVTALTLSHIRGSLETENGTGVGYWTVYADLNDNGVREESEPVASSDRTGEFALTGLVAGTYTIRTELPAGWAEAEERDGLTVTVAAGEISTDNDFVLAPNNSSVVGGVHFVTTAPTAIQARQTYRYSAVATAIGDVALNYDLSLAPQGMSVDPNTGMVAWHPTVQQVAEHLVILRATDEFGSVSLHDFTVTVTAPNSAPVFANEPAAVAYVGATYVFQAVAQDSDAGELMFALVNGPDGTSVDATTGELRWMPVAANVGDVSFEILVRDAGGAETRKSFSVNVVVDQPAATPFEIESPRTVVGLGQNYLARVSGVDQLDRPLAWTLVSGPAGFSAATDGTLSWSPSNFDLGDQAIELLATNPDGQIESFEFTLSVIGRSVNSAPVVESEPTVSAVIGNEYSYDVFVGDSNSDPLSYELLEAPSGMSIHPLLGTIRWVPAADQLGEADVLVEVTDPSGASTTQEFTLKVSRSGGPPIISSTPPTEVNVGGSFLYSVIAVDAEADPLTYRFLTAPAGATINATTGEIAWTPTSVQIGLQSIVIEVSDGIGGAATQGFAILVGDGVVNLPPEISSTAPRFTAVGEDYNYQISATDPESTTLSYSVRRGPAGLAVNANGLVSWAPMASQTGQFVVTLVVTDAGGASSIESFELDVLAQNRAPVVDSTAPTEMFAGEEFRYDVLVSDADADALAFELILAPDGASIDAFGRIRWSTNNDLIGQHDFEIKVTDPRGGETSQTFTLDVVADTQSPVLLLSDLNDENFRNILPWQGPIRVFARASDNVGVASLTMTANGVVLPVDGSGVATLAFDDYLFSRIVIEAIATDVNGNVTTKTIDVDYDYPEGWDGAGAEEIPTAVISSPAEAGTAIGMASVVGTASHDNFGSYTLSYRHFDDTEFTEITSSTNAVENGELGVWDTTLLRNDEYVLRLEVLSGNGVVNVVEQNVGLAGELKLGNFQLSFTDLVIPVAGIPIEITRVYDTLQSDVVGEFGFGWRLEYRDTNLQVGLPKTGLEDIGIYTPFRPGVKVYLNIPGEGRQGFTFDPEIKVLPGLGGDDLVLARPKFTADVGVSSTLGAGVNGYLQVNEFGELFAPGGVAYNPASADFGGSYVVTTAEGIVYRIDGNEGKLLEVVDSEGNILSFTDDAISSSAGGIQVDLLRNVNGQITTITDPQGNSISYAYASNGNLSGVIDRLGNESLFEYEAETHILNGVRDPLGRIGVRTEYDQNGRISAIIDGFGKRTEIDFDTENEFQAITDANGNTSTFFYDSFGNISREVDALGGITSREFNDFGDETLIVDANGDSTSYEYDHRGRPIRVTDAHGNESITQYDDLNESIHQVDSLGRVTAIETLGDRQVLRDQTGETLVETSDNVSTVVDSTGLTTWIEFDSRGNELSVTDSSGRNASYTYDLLGNVLVETRILDGVGYLISHQYDQNGNRIATTDALGNTERFEFDELNQMVLSIDQLGRRTAFSYDFAGNLVETILPDETPADSLDNPRLIYEYDDVGNLVGETNEAGSTTRYVYDELNRRISTVFPNDSASGEPDSEGSEYDSIGRVIARTNALGGRTEFKFDEVGNLIESTNPLGFSTIYQHDSLGRVVSITDASGATTRVAFDDANLSETTLDSEGYNYSRYFTPAGQEERVVDELGVEEQFKYSFTGQLETVTNSLGNSTSYQYDTEGRLVSQEDANGHVTRYEYDANGQLLVKTYPLGQTEKFRYDEVGNVMAFTNANDQLVTYSYDSQNRLVSEVRPEQTILFSYTPTNQLAKVVDDRGETSYTYDLRDRLTSKTEPDGTRTEFSYDGAGNRTSVVTPGGARFFSYDRANQLTSASDVSDRTTRWTYDPVGRVSSTQYPNSLTEEFTYDSRGLLVGASTFNDSGVVVSGVQYVVDAAGRRTRIEYSDGRVVELEQDSDDRLVSETSTLAGDSSQRTFVYDAVGNRISQEVDGLRTDFVYDQNDRLLSETNSASQVTYRYDERGQMTEKLVVADGQAAIRTRFSWNSTGQMTGIDLNGDASIDIEYDYDVDGNRIGERSATEGERSFLVDPTQALSQVLEEYVPSGEIEAVFTIAPDASGPLSQVRNGQAYYYHYDGVGSVLAISDATGAVVNSYSYSAYGEVLTAVENVPNRHQFGGGRTDVGGLLHLRARVYDSATGRFASHDPLSGRLGEPLKLHRYIYAGNAPANKVDPSGQEFTLAGTLNAMAINVTVSGTFTILTGGGLKEFAFGVALGATFGVFAKGLSVLTFAGGKAGSLAANQAAKAGGTLVENFVIRTMQRLGPNAAQLERLVAQGSQKALEEISKKAGARALFQTTQNIAKYIPAQEWAKVPQIIVKASQSGKFGQFGLGFASDVVQFLRLVRPFP